MSRVQILPTPMPLNRHTFPLDEPTRDYWSDVRAQLQNGDVLLCSGTRFFSTLIQGATDSVWSHAAMVLKLDNIDRIMLLESVEPLGVRCVRLSKYLDNYANDGQPYPGGMVVVRHAGFAQRADAAGLTRMAQYAVDQFGYPYDRDEIAKIALRIAAAKIHLSPEQRERIVPDREFICSEYVARCYEQLGLDIAWDRLGFIAPADIAGDANFSLLAVLRQP